MPEGDNRRMQSIHKGKKEDGDVMDGSVTSVRAYHPCVLMILLTLTFSTHSLLVLYLLLENLFIAMFYACSGAFSAHRDGLADQQHCTCWRMTLERLGFTRKVVPPVCKVQGHFRKGFRHLRLNGHLDWNLHRSSRCGCTLAAVSLAGEKENGRDKRETAGGTAPLY